MNLFVLFSENIYEIIDASMKTTPIFQAPHSKDFMDLNHAMYTPTSQEFESIASGQGSPTCEDLDLEPIHFNVGGNLMSHGLSNHATPTIINSPTTPTVPINQNATTHWDGLPLPFPYYTSSGQCSM